MYIPTWLILSPILPDVSKNTRSPFSKFPLLTGVPIVACALAVLGKLLIPLDLKYSP